MEQSNGQNFHGHIALPLETITNSYLQTKSPLMISADMISIGGFIPVMSFLLISKHGCSCEVVDFLKVLARYNGMAYNNIPYDEAKRMFDKFCQIFNENF